MLILMFNTLSALAGLSLAQSAIYNASKKGLTAIPTGIPENTEELLLSGNSIKTINDFPNLQGLWFINLGHNRLDLFPNLCSVNSSLTKLHLHKNKISSIDFPLLDCFAHLEILHLQHNLLTMFPLVSNLVGSLTTLFVSYNHLQVLPEFDILAPKLKYLQAGSNPLNITQIPSSVLELASEMIQFGWSGYNLGKLDVRVFSKFAQLKYLTLIDDNLSEFPDLAPFGIKLRSLSISSNPITHIDWDFITSLPHLNKLTCKKCQLVTLPMICHMGPKLTINIQNNPLVCDERIKWIKAGYLSRKILTRVKPCAGPAELTNTPVTSLTVRKLTNNNSAMKTYRVKKLDMSTFGCTRLRGQEKVILVTDMEKCALHMINSPDSLAFRFIKNQTGGEQICKILTFAAQGNLLVFDEDMFVME